MSEKYIRLSTSSSRLVQSYNLKRILSRCQIYPETRTKSAIKLDKLPHLKVLDDTARYAGLLLAPAEGFGLRSRVFLALRAKKTPYYAVLAHFWFPVVTMVTFSNNLSTFVRKP